METKVTLRKTLSKSPPTMSKLSRENTASKMKGAGDGIKTMPRTPVPSSRKFTPTLVRDESVQLKLKKVLDDLEAKQRSLRKSKTVAEITPTKSTRRNRVKRPAVGGSTVLHATPRPPMDDARWTAPPSGRDAKERRLQQLVYHRMLVFVWRRSKKRLAMVSESLRRRQEQISNLEKQVNCLKDLTQSECHKRGEAMGEYQRMESILQTVRMENSSLIAAKVVLQNELDELRNKFDNSCIELLNMKNEINTKNIYVKRLEQEIHIAKKQLTEIQEENKVLADTVKDKKNEMKAREEDAEKLNRAVADLEKRLRECEEEKKLQKRSTEEWRAKVKGCDSLRHELRRVCCDRDAMSRKIKSLEDKLAETSCSYEVVVEENANLKERMEKKWWTSTKEFVQVSWAVLQHAAYLMLPAM